jgi:hypothetical protein
MRRTLSVLTAVLVVVCASYFLHAQDSQRWQMTFFVTSAGLGDGGNLGGLAGADAQCQKLAVAAGANPSKTWHAYLSTQGPNAVNARDRIGKGPWQNADGGALGINATVPELHGETGQGTPMNRTVALTEKGRLVTARDILTGSTPDGKAFSDGMDHTCNNWTSNSMGSAQVGHHDRASPGGGGGGGGAIGGGGGAGPADTGNQSWNSSHSTKGCSQADLQETGGRGLFYCFATN